MYKFGALGTFSREGIEVLKQISPVAWQHINLYGRYEFRKCSEPIDLDDIVRQLTQVQSY